MSPNLDNSPNALSARRFSSLGVLDALRDFHLPSLPYLQIVLSRLVLGLDYRFPKPTSISIEGLHHLEGPQALMIAMNHTDRFNYMPFMHELDLRGYPPLAPWVKGKYYQNPRLARLLSWCACMPVPSRGFLLSLDWLARRGRSPGKEEYRQLRLLGDGITPDSMLPEVEDYLNLAPGGGPEGFFREFQKHFEGLTGEVVRINKEAMALGYRPLVFPQGTRSRALTRGFSGVVQMALHTGVRIVPVGVSGSDRLYPGDRPFSVGGAVHYSVGEPFDPASVGRVPKGFSPLTIKASQEHGECFQEITDLLMERINDLLPSPYQFQGQEKGAFEEGGAERFV